jgi:hypothetical protein
VKNNLLLREVSDLRGGAVMLCGSIFKQFDPTSADLLARATNLNLRAGTFTFRID